MPITMLKIPQRSCQKVDTQEAKTACETIGEILHLSLRIPDPKDREILIYEDTKGCDTALEIAFTAGPNEYPGYKPPSFSPRKNRIRVAGNKIRDFVDSLPFEIPNITVGVWKNTTFLLRGDEDNITITQPTIDLAEKMTGEIREARIKLVLSPNKYQGRVSGIGVEGGGYGNEFDGTFEAVSGRLREILGLPEGSVGLEIVRATAADTDTSVEFDCETKSKRPIPEGVRKFMAKTVMETLNNDGKIKEGSAEVWIRQNDPVTYRF